MHNESHYTHWSLRHTGSSLQYNKYVGLLYCRSEMYPGRVACCPLVSHAEYTDRTDEPTERAADARPLHYAFARRGQRDNSGYIPNSLWRRPLVVARRTLLFNTQRGRRRRCRCDMMLRL